MSHQLRIHRGREPHVERAARIATLIAVGRIDRLPPPQRPDEYRRLLLAVTNEFCDPRAVLRAVVNLIDDGTPVAA